MAEKKKTIAEKIEERVQAWLDSANSFSEGAKAQYSTEGYRGNTKEYYDSVTASVAASQKEAETIRKMLQGYGSYVGDDYVKKVTKYLDDFGGYENQILAAAKQDYEYFSRFDDENAYTQYKAGEKNRADIDALDASALKQKLDSANSAKSIREEINRLQSISDSDIYNQIWSAGYRGDKAEKFVEQYKKGIADEISKYQAELDTYEGITDIAYTTPDGKNVSWQSLYDRKSFEEDLANQMAEAKADSEYIGLVAQANSMIPSGAMLSRDDNRIAAYRGVFGEHSMMRGEQNKDVKLARAMTKDEADLYGYYLMTQGVGRAEEYFRSMYETLDRRATENLVTQWKGIASEHPGLSSAVSVGGTLASGSEYLADIAMQIATGKEQYNTTSAVTSAIRGTVAEEIDWTIGNWDAGSFVYNTFMSGVDSLVSGLTLSAGGGIALGLSAAASATNDALDRGLSNKQAFWNGLASGVFEGLFETISIGQFGAMKDAIVHGGKDFAKNLVKSMVTNATEEFATEVANVLYDNLVNLDYSQYETDKRMYVALGMSEEEAHRKASEQIISQISEAAASGALMGIGFGAVGSSISGVRSMMSDIDTGAVIAQNNMIAPLVELAKETTSPKSKAYRIAEKVTDKTSARRIGALMREVGYALTEQNKTDITNSLIERGMDAREAKKTATALSDIAGSESVDTAIEKAEKNGVIIDDTVEAVIRDVVLNPESTVGSRSAKLAEYGTRLTDSVVRSAGMQGISEEDAVNLKKEAEFYGIGADEFLASAQASNATPAHFSRAFKERYLQGKIGDKTVSKYVNSYLSETEQNTAYRLGEIAAKAERESAQKREAAMPKKKVESGTGRVTVDSSVSAASREGAKTQIQAVEKIAEALGIRVRFYESVVSENGNRVLSTNKDTAAPNGWFDKDTNTVHLDIKAGKDGKGFVMFTLAHELTHFIAKWSKTQFNVLADFVTARYNKEGKDITRTIRNRMMNLAEQNIKSYMALTTEEARYEYAREEVIADSMETMLTSGNVMRDLADLRTQSEGLFNKIRGFLKQFADKIRKLYQKISPETEEGKFIAESKDAVEELEKLFANALKVSAENYAAEGNVGVELDPTSESVSPSSVMSLRTWTASEYVQNRRQTAKILAKALDISEEKALRYIDTVNSVAKKIADDKVRLDYEASSFGSAFVSNVEYGGSFDYTTLCKKRRLYTGTFTEIQKRLKDAVLTPDEILEIRNLMIDAGYEATCGLCYVEGSRANMGKFAKEFIKLYKRDNPDSWTPTMADVNTPDGVEAMRINHPDTYDQYVYFWNHYGKLKDTDKALFASQQKPKLYEARKEYKGEILDNFKKDDSVEKKNLNGGIRMQSFSDFEIVHLIDTMQVIMDMSRVGLAGQAYTKVPEFAKAFGNTGLKINLSLIAKGVDSKGNLIFDDREGMPHETAFEIRNQYSKNVGTIIVTFTDEQLLAAMADDRIDFIIPFHRSQWKKGQYGAMGLPKGTKDYTFMQNEKLIKQTYHEYQGRMVKDKASNYMPNEYWDFSKSGKENAEAYLEMCAANNKRPKFYKLLDFDGKGKYSLKKDGSTDGYWKLLIDFKMYDNDGIGSPQMAVTPDFSMDEAMTMLDEYKGGHNTYPVAYDVVDRFVEKYESSPTPSDSAVMSIRNTNHGKVVWIENSPIKESQLFSHQDVANYIASHIGEVYTIIESGQKVYIGKDLPGEYTQSVYTQNILKSRTLLKAKNKAVGNFGEMIEIATNRRWSKDKGSGKKDAKFGVYKYKTQFAFPVLDSNNNIVGAKAFSATLIIVNSSDGKKYLYDMVGIKKSTPVTVDLTNQIIRANAAKTTSAVQNGSATTKIAQNPPVVKTSDKNSSPSDNSMHSTRATTDSAYLDAVSRGDMDTAQRMVDEAARKAGYNSPKLYHGTKTFGFTRVKTSGVEEGFDWSPFFAANKEEVSSTYVPYSRVRDVYSSMDEDAAEEARESAIEDRRENISNLVDEFRHLIDIHFSEWVFVQSDNSYLEGLVEEANPEAGNGDGVYDVLSDIVLDCFYDYRDLFEEYEDSEDWSENSPEGQEIFSKIAEIEGEKLALYRLESGESLGGIYQLYANLDNMYIIDGNGTDWNNLRSEDLPKIDRYGIKDVPYKTRDVANWAREKGYDGVIFKNIRDSGEYGKSPVGDVYAFFYPESQVKSADPVTYDDDRNVIPLSERFQSDNPDIRYQLRETREYTDRELLAGALDSVATSEEDRKKLTQYKKKAAEADELDRTLSELRAKKKALEEAKAKRSEIRAVQDEITKTENRITIIDKQLFNLQATVSMKRVLESEKKRRAKQARAKQKASDDAKRKKAVSDAVKEAEDDYQKKLDAQKKHQAEIEARRKERASRTELRHKIIDKVKKLSDKLRNPSKDKHIPASLQKPVARFLSAISIDTFGADKMINRNLKKLEALLEKLEKETNDIDRSVLMDKIAELQKSIQWEEAIGVSIKEKASTMRSAYEALANDKDPRVQDGYDQVVADMLKEVVEVCGDTPLRYMTLEQLTTLNDAINAVNKRVSESNKAFSEGKKKTIEEYAESTARELPDTSKASVVKFVKAIKRFGWGLLKPATAMEIIGSQTFTELYENIQDGEETWMQNIAKAKAFFQEIATKHGYYSWDLQKTYDFVDTRGKTFTLTLGEMLSLYAYSRRPQAAKHLEEGGFKFDEKSDERRKKKNRKNDKENHKLNRDILKVIENKIGETEGALEFANELQAYLSKDMAALGNEISMRMYDYLAFGEENYFPIYSSKSYIDFNPDSQGNILLKNRSFTKSVAKGANNPIIVGDFVDIWTRHVNEMITYNAFALPVEDFMRTYNFKFKTADGSQDSIKDRIVKAYGEDAAKYIEQLLRDINGGVIADHSAEFADALVTRFKKLKVMLSASVVIQQPSAMARAFAMIDPKYFRGIGVGNHAERWERVMKYAPIAMIKAMGRFDINLGQSAQDYLTAQEYSGAKEKAKAVFTDKNYRDEVLTRAPAYADEMAWITIFEACEREMAEFRPDLEKGSEKFMQLVGRRFTEVIRSTQVYDSVFSRSQIMRSKNVFTKMITAFMSEPTTTLNMAFRSMLEASRSGKKWYALPFNRTMAAVSTSIILNSLLVSIVYAMRDDDEDETYLESYLESFTTEVADGFNPLTYIPFVKDIWSLLQGYDVERTDMALWSDIIDKAYDFIKVFSTDTSEMSEEAYDKWLKDVWSQSASAVSEILSFATGIPITNVIRDASGAVDTTVDALTSDRENSWDTMLDAIAEGFKNTLPGSNLKPNNPAKYDPTYSDYTSYKPKDAFAQFDRGNTAKGKEIIDKLIKARMEAGDTEKEAKASLRSSFTSTYKDAYKKAYLAGDNAECVRIRKLLKDSGLFPNYIETYMSWQKEALQDKYKK